MQNNFDNQIETIKKIDIKEVVSKETGLSFKRSTLSKCPFCDSGKHDNGTSAFHVQTSKNIFKCFSCEKKGGVIEFIKFNKGFENKQAIEYLIKNYSHIPLKESEPETKTDLSKTIFSIKKNSIEKATDYLKSRSIETEKLPKESYFYDAYSNAIVFVDANQTLVNKRFIAPEQGKPKVIQAKGSILGNSLYTSVYKPESEKVFLVEGVINALSLFPYSSLAIFSTGNKFTNAKKLSKYLAGKTVILAFDNDVKKENEHNAGKECADYYINFIQENIEVKSLVILNLPENKDINDLKQSNELSEYLKDTDNYQFLKTDILEKPLLQNSKDANFDFRKFGFYTKDSQYFIKQIINSNTIEKHISDCVMEFLYKLNDEDGTRLIKIQQMELEANEKQKVELLEIKSNELSKDKFKSKLLNKGFNFIGTQPNLDNIIMYNTHREKQANKIETYGYQPESKMFVFSDCAINSNNELIKPNSIGMLTDNKTNEIYYLPTASPANLENTDLTDLRLFTYKHGKIDFKTFAKLFYASNQMNGSIGIMFYILSLFRDIIVKHLDFFPYLFLYGTAGGGKTSYSEILTRLTGDYSKGVDLKDITQAALARIASQKRNTITYYKEYKTDAAPFVEQYFKAGYDCVSRTVAKGGTGTGTITFSIESSGLLDSNFLPTNEEAVFSRMIILDFESANFNDIQQRKAFFELKEHKEEGLTQITKEVLKHRTLFEDNFKDVFYSVLDTIKNGKMKNFKDRERAFKHVALILTPFHILNSVLKFPFDIETLENIMVAHAEAQYSKLNEFKTTTLFWQALAYYKTEKKVFEYTESNSLYERSKSLAHYVKLQRSENVGTIFIRKIDDLHLFYVDYCKRKGMPFDSIGDLKAKLLSKGYEPFISNATEKKLTTKNAKIGSSYAFQFTYNKKDENIIIDNIEIDL